MVAATAVIGLTLNTLLYEGASRFSIREEEARRASEHIVIVVPHARGRSAGASGEDRGVHLDGALQARVAYRSRRSRAQGPSRSGKCWTPCCCWEPSLRDWKLQLYLGSPTMRRKSPALCSLRDGSWLHFRAQDLIGGWQLQLGQIVIAGLPMLALVIVAMIALRSISRARCAVSRMP